MHELYARRGAKFMEFAGWEVPLSFTGIVDEHKAVRGHAGLFDVSHMGKFRVRGDGARAFLERALSNGVRKIGPGRAQYSLILNSGGGVVDDIILYQISRDHFFLIVNAATRNKDFRWIDALKPPSGVELADESDQRVILAVQGPRSEALLSRLFNWDFSHVPPFHFCRIPFTGDDLFVAATGYTGERGFEIVAENSQAEILAENLFAEGKDLGLVPAGFGARDTLRLESAYLLYGQDMDEETSALEAGLGWVCDFSKDFIGREPLERQKRSGLSKQLVGFELIEPGIARHGQSVFFEGCKAGLVTSGTFSPTLGKAIGLAYVPPAAVSGGFLEIEIREKRVKAKIVRTPFYKR